MPRQAPCLPVKIQGILAPEKEKEIFGSYLIFLVGAEDARRTSHKNKTSHRVRATTVPSSCKVRTVKS